MIDKFQQWFFLGVLVLAIVAPPIGFYLTRSPLCFTSYVTTDLLSQLAQRIFPPGGNETKITRPKSAKKRRFR
jgi:hypothetical protein